MSYKTIIETRLWQDCRQLATLVFKVTKNQKFSKDFRFKDQIRSASGSTMDNLAEGFGRGGNKEFIHFISISIGSNMEVLSQIHRAFDYEYINKEDLTELFNLSISINKQLIGLTKYLKSSKMKGVKFS